MHNPRHDFLPHVETFQCALQDPVQYNFSKYSIERSFIKDTYRSTASQLQLASTANVFLSDFNPGRLDMFGFIYCRNSCDGKTSCTLRADNGIFGDPCGGVEKYLEVRIALGSAAKTQLCLCRCHTKRI